jgi:hypothetical protein
MDMLLSSAQKPVGLWFYEKKTSLFVFSYLSVLMIQRKNFVKNQKIFCKWFNFADLLKNSSWVHKWLLHWYLSTWMNWKNSKTYQKIYWPILTTIRNSKQKFRFGKCYFFYYFIIHMCIQGLGHFSPLPPPPPLPPTLPPPSPPHPLNTQQKLFCPYF